ncbi:MAG: hypothetical protein ACJ74Y_01055 [Bryobacteraceae bacterium]
MDSGTHSLAMRPIQCRYCGTFEPTSEHFMNFRCSLRPSEIGRELPQRPNVVEAEDEIQLVEELYAA